MYVITGNRLHNDKVTKINKSVATYISEEKLEIPELVDGELYRIVYQSRNGADIGILDGDYIKSGVGSTRHYSLIERVNPTDLSVLILNTDGKQRGRDLVGENIGNTFPIIEVGSHDTYKYIIDIDGKPVALSIDNVMFFDPPIKDFPTMKFIKYRGVTLFVKDVRNGVVDGLYCIDFNTGNTMYVYNNNYEILDDAVRVGFNPSTLEFLDTNEMVKLTEDVVTGYTGKKFKFNLTFPIKENRDRGQIYVVFMFFATTKKYFDQILKTLPKKFRYDERNGVFYFNG